MRHNSQPILIGVGIVILLLILAAFTFWGGNDIADENGTPLSTTTQNGAGETTGTATPSQQRQVSLYFYNESKDKDASGNVRCSKEGLDPVIRTIPATSTDPVGDTLHMLLRGGITAVERARGITSEFPLPGVTLTRATLGGGVLTLAIADPEGWTSGGACRVSILAHQIEATALQFPEVKSVRFTPAERFQP